MTRNDLDWKESVNHNKHICYRLSDGKVLGEVEKGITYWAEVGNKQLGNYVDAASAKRSVELKLIGETK